MTGGWFDRITVAIGVIMLNIMLVVGLLQVLSRYFTFPVPLYWTYEIARTFLALMTIIALPYMFRNESDISFLPVLKRITSRTDELLLLRNVFMAVLAGILVVSAYLAAVLEGDVSLPMIGWFKIGWGYTLLGVSSALLLGVIILDTKSRLSSFQGDTDV
ncbi:TRAP transporter small permease [Haloarcula amylolytica]|jgi:TRAP-type C4-dicarboxylate transport system permease small subunit|uniref:TRAP transporter small permease n=1 Tax=Haloarcula amylolytica TaxID=396317 RepID=UPI003C75BC5F